MAEQSVIQIKRSTSTATPTSLVAGEIAYSFNSNSFFIGDPQNSNSALRIGGGDFTYIYDVTPGTLAGTKAIVTNSSSFVDDLKTASITIGSNSATSIANTVGAGSGVALATTAAVKAYADAIDVTITLSADSGTNDTYTTGETLTFAGNTGITTTVSDNQIDVDLDDTAVTPGTYGDATNVGSFTVDQQGRITAASDAAIDHDQLTNFEANEHIDHSSVTLSAGNGLTGGGNITASRTFAVGAGNGITSNADDVAVNAQDGLTANSSGLFVVAGNNQVVANSSGVFIEESNINHDNLSGFVADEHIDHSSVSITAGNGLTGGGNITATRTVTVGAGNGITVNTDDVAVNAQNGLSANSSGVFVVAGTGVTANATGVHIGQAVGTTDNVTFNNVTVDGTLNSDDITASTVTISGNLVVSGTTTTVNTEEINLADNTIVLNSNHSGAPSQDAGFTVNRGTSANVSLLWDETEDYWTFGTETVDIQDVSISGGTITGITDIAVADGGTGKSTVTTNAVLYGQGTSALAEATGSAHQILQLNASGVPVFGNIDGGTF